MGTRKISTGDILKGMGKDLTHKLTATAKFFKTHTGPCLRETVKSGLATSTTPFRVVSACRYMFSKKSDKYLDDKSITVAERVGRSFGGFLGICTSAGQELIYIMLATQGNPEPLYFQAATNGVDIVREYWLHVEKNLLKNPRHYNGC